MKKPKVSNVKLALGKKTIHQKLAQGQKVIDKSKASPHFSGTQPLLDDLDGKHATLVTAQAAVDAASATKSQLTAVRNVALSAFHTSYRGWGNNVDTVAAGASTVILDSGLEVSSDPKPTPPLLASTSINAGMGDIPGDVKINWAKVLGARTYEVQYTDDLTGADGWTSLAKLTGKIRTVANGLDSGTNYLFRVRALGLGEPGPWSATTQQMAP